MTPNLPLAAAEKLATTSNTATDTSATRRSSKAAAAKQPVYRSMMPISTYETDQVM
jgi:hypothetical protein